jgi:hypothetical protein
MIGLVLHHGAFSLRVPLSARRAGQIILFDQSLLNFSGSVRIDAALPRGSMVLVPGQVNGNFMVVMTGRGSPVRAACERWGDCQCG